MDLVLSILLSFDWPDWIDLNIWITLLSLIFLELILGIDNLMFIAITAEKLDTKHKSIAARLGLFLALVLRIVLLFTISSLISLNTILYEFKSNHISATLTGHSLILLLGGAFLLYKSSAEITNKWQLDVVVKTTRKKLSLTYAIVQIALINLVLSIDSILTAIVLTQSIKGDVVLMSIAVVISVLLMIWVQPYLQRFVLESEGVQILGLGILILISLMLLLEAAHLAQLSIGNFPLARMPKGYLYFAVGFYLLIELIRLRIQKIRPNS